MKKQEIEVINEMRLQGKSASEIARKLSISVNTVRSYIRRHPDLVGGNPCKNCGKSIMAVPGRKEKLFCSLSLCYSTTLGLHKNVMVKDK